MKLFLSLLLLAGAARAGDWPQFHGPNRDNRSAETNLLARWPEGGPHLLWRAAGLGEGYASAVISAGRIFTAGNIASNTILTALDLAGQPLWQATNGPAYRRSMPGARATPTVAGEQLYHLNGDGDIACLDTATGRTLWSLNMLEKFGGRNIQWGLSEALLVDGDRVIACPGGSNILMVALDRHSGRTVWQTPGTGDKPGYTAPQLINVAGQRQIVTMTSGAAIGVAPDTGRLLWRFEMPAPYEVNASHPVYHDGQLAIFGTWGRGAYLLRLKPEGDRCAVEQVWHTTELDNEHGSVVLVNGALFGHADGNHKHRHWACLDWATGRTLWTSEELPGPRSGTLTTAAGMLYLMNEKRQLALAPADPQKLDLVSRFELPAEGQGPSWAHPVICNGRLYIRYSQYLYAFDIAVKN
jgi:outer membrane protein assembly factor BamB